MTARHALTTAAILTIIAPMCAAVAHLLGGAA